MQKTVNFLMLLEMGLCWNECSAICANLIDSTILTSDLSDEDIGKIIVIISSAIHFFKDQESTDNSIQVLKPFIQDFVEPVNLSRKNKKELESKMDRVVAFDVKKASEEVCFIFRTYILKEERIAAIQYALGRCGPEIDNFEEKIVENLLDLVKGIHKEGSYDGDYAKCLVKHLLTKTNSVILQFICLEMFFDLFVKQNKKKSTIEEKLKMLHKQDLARNNVN